MIKMDEIHFLKENDIEECQFDEEEETMNW